MIFGVYLVIAVEDSSAKRLRENSANSCDTDGICQKCINEMTSTAAGPYWKITDSSGECVSCKDSGTSKPFFNPMTKECIAACPEGLIPSVGATEGKCKACVDVYTTPSEEKKFFNTTSN